MFVAVDRFVAGSWFVPGTVSVVWTVRLSESEEAVLLRGSGYNLSGSEGRILVRIQCRCLRLDEVTERSVLERAVSRDGLGGKRSEACLFFDGVRRGVPLVDGKRGAVSLVSGDGRRRCRWSVETGDDSADSLLSGSGSTVLLRLLFVGATVNNNIIYNS